MSSKVPIDYPATHSEFEVQSLLFSILKDLGFNARGEVTTRQWDHKKSGHRTASILDVVVFDESEEPALIIEVKSACSGAYPVAQVDRYDGLHGVPTIACVGLGDVRMTVWAVLEIFGAGDQVKDGTEAA